MKSKFLFLDSIYIFFIIILLFTFSLIEMFYPIHIDRNNYEILYFAADFGFLNSLHVIFTFVGLLLIKDMNTWWRARASVGDGFQQKVFLHFIIIISAYFFFYENPRIQPLIRIPVACLGLHHAIMQSYGMFIFNQDFLIRQKIKNIFLLLIACHVCLFITTEVIQHIEYSSLLATLKIGIFVLELALISFLFFLMRHHNPSLLFLFRLFLFPLSIYSSVAAIGIATIHGSEYFLIFKKIFKSKDVKPYFNGFNKANVFACFLTLTLVVCFVLNYRHGFLHFVYSGPKTSILQMIASFTDTLALSHFYLDRHLFMFRGQLSQKHILKLIS